MIELFDVVAIETGTTLAVKLCSRIDRRVRRGKSGFVLLSCLTVCLWKTAKDTGYFSVLPIQSCGCIWKYGFGKVSQMPVGLLHSLNRDEIRDLTAYIMSGGNSNHKRFAKQGKQ
jgi:hypothetical protein